MIRRNDINTIQISGRLARVDDVRYARSNNKPFIVASLAFNTLEDIVNYITLVFIDDNLDLIKDIKVGDKILVSGRLATKNFWSNKYKLWLQRASIFVTHLLPINLKPTKQEIKELKKQAELDQIPF